VVVDVATNAQAGVKFLCDLTVKFHSTAIRNLSTAISGLKIPIATFPNETRAANARCALMTSEFLSFKPKAVTGLNVQMNTSFAEHALTISSSTTAAKFCTRLPLRLASTAQLAARTEAFNTFWARRVKDLHVLTQKTR
jgi:hypothetical protein